MTADSFVFLNVGYKGRVVRVGDIVTINVSKNELSVRLHDKTLHVIRGSLVNVMRKLPSDLFFVVDRNCAVNLSQIGKVNGAMRNISLQLTDGREIIVSREQSRAFRKQLTL